MRQLTLLELEDVAGGGPPPPEFPGVTDPDILQSLYNGIGSTPPYGTGTGFGPGGDGTTEEPEEELRLDPIVVTPPQAEEEAESDHQFCWNEFDTAGNYYSTCLMNDGSIERTFIRNPYTS